MGITEMNFLREIESFNRAFKDSSRTLQGHVIEKQSANNRETIGKQSTKHREKLFSSKEIKTLNRLTAALLSLIVKLSAFLFFESINIFFSNIILQN